MRKNVRINRAKMKKAIALAGGYLAMANHLGRTIRSVQLYVQKGRAPLAVKQLLDGMFKQKDTANG